MSNMTYFGDVGGFHEKGPKGGGVGGEDEAFVVKAAQKHYK